jgi:quinol monooxygenase YgiN
MHYVMARITVKPEAVAATVKLFADLAGPTRQEAGCVSYEVFQQQPSPHVFQTVEQWRSEADAQSHMQTPHVAAAFATAGPLLAAPPEILAYTRL